MDGDALIYTIETSPAHGTVTLSGKVVKYTPTNDYYGDDSFSFIVNDGMIDSTSAVVSITVKEVDTIAPLQPTLTTEAPTYTSNNSLDIEVNGEVGAKVYINGNEVGIIGSNGKLSVTLDLVIGNNEFNITLKDSTGNESDVLSITVEYDTDIHITQSYQVIPLGNSNVLNKKIHLDSTAKNLYLVLSNTNDVNISSVTVKHSKISSSDTNKMVFNNVVQPTPVRQVPMDILRYNKDASKYFKINEHNNIVAPAPNRSSVGDSQSFYLNDDTSLSTTATLRKANDNIDTNVGNKSVHIWVSNDSFDSGNGCSKATCVTQAMVDEMANKFLSNGSDNDIYDWVTNIYGQEWGTDAHEKYSNLITTSNTIDILLTDIDNDNSKNGGVAGYFWSKDNIDQATVSGSNQRIMFYADSVMFANTEHGDFWQKVLYSTLAHEFQHMIHFYQKSVIQGAETSSWLNEMMSVTTEYLVVTKLEHDGDRGVAYTDGSAGASGNSRGRFPRFNQNNSMTLTNWGNALEDYSKVASFGAFLTNNYAGANLLHHMMFNDSSDEKAITDAIVVSTGKNVSFNQLLQEWGIAMMLSDHDNLDDSTPKYNTGDFTTSIYNGINYEMGSINFFNYNPSPTIHAARSDILPHANYYYKIGENITDSFVDLNITLNSDTEVTLIAK